MSPCIQVKLHTAREGPDLVRSSLMSHASLFPGLVFFSIFHILFLCFNVLLLANLHIQFKGCSVILAVTLLSLGYYEKVFEHAWTGLWQLGRLNYL